MSNFFDPIYVEIRRSTRKPGKFSVFLSGTSIITGGTLKFCRENAFLVATCLHPGLKFRVRENLKPVSKQYLKTTLFK